MVRQGYPGRRSRWWALAAALLAGCNLVSNVPAGARDLVTRGWTGRYFCLKHSVYAGPFWDDPRLTLLDERPFSELPYLTDPTGRPVSPGSARAVIPAGTRVRVESVEFPTWGTVLGRPLMQPRYNIWVLLRVDRFDMEARRDFQDRVHVMLLPQGLRDPAEVDQALSERLGDESVRTWVRSRAQDVRAAIARKDVVAGMTQEEVTASLGQPDEVRREFSEAGLKQVMSYGARQVVLMDGQVQASAFR